MFPLSNLEIISTWFLLLSQLPLSSFTDNAFVYRTTNDDVARKLVQAESFD